MVLPTLISVNKMIPQIGPEALVFYDSGLSHVDINTVMYTCILSKGNSVRRRIFYFVFPLFGLSTTLYKQIFKITFTEGNIHPCLL